MSRSRPHLFAMAIKEASSSKKPAAASGGKPAKPEAKLSPKAAAAAVRIADNKKANFNYHIEERFEAGMVLEGWEVKSVREGKVQLTDGYVVIRNGEVFIIGCQINPMGKVEQKGFTLVPLNMHWKNGRVKCEIGLAKGKGEHDKRDTIKDREGKREVERAMKSKNR